MCGCGGFFGGYGSFMIYYLKYVAGNQNLFSIYSACQLAEMIGLLIFPFVAKKLGGALSFIP